jgi:hypothetical protein
MLVAHLAPGYFAAVKSQPSWRAEWGQGRRRLLWAVALGSTVAPDLDVIYNVLLRGFFNHSILWPHSLWPHLGLGLAWWALRRAGRWPYLQTLLGLAAFGGLSHLALDVLVHGTPLLYPFSLEMFDVVATRVVQGDVWAYIRAPIFLVEPLALALVALHYYKLQRA